MTAPLPPNAVIEAARRWLELLREANLEHTWSIIRSTSSFLDITQTQYLSALDWLRVLGLLDETPGSGRVIGRLAYVSPQIAARHLLEAALEHCKPLWLVDADTLVNQVGDLPMDWLSAANVLEVDEFAVLASIRRVHGKINLEERRRIGAAGETTLIDILERKWPGSTCHVAAENDGFGYDVAFTHGGVEWHLEVKSTTRRGRLSVYLSRNEYEFGLRDPQWRVIAIGLDEDLRLRAMATVKPNVLNQLVPQDKSARGVWQATAFELTPAELDEGLALAAGLAYCDLVPPRDDDRQRPFAWLP